MKEHDREFLLVLADLIQMIYRAWEHTQSDEIKSTLDGFIADYEQLKQKVETHDYTQEDRILRETELIVGGKSYPQMS